MSPTDHDDAQLISQGEFAAIEAAIHDAYAKTPLIADNSMDACWQFCQFVEIYSVFACLRAFDQGSDLGDQSHLIAELDSVKLAMELALALIARKLPKQPQVSVTHQVFNGQLAETLRRRSLEYAQAYWLFAPAKARSTTFWRREGSHILETRWPERDQQYWALQRILPLQAPGFTPIWDMIAVLFGPDAIVFEDTPIDWSVLCQKIAPQVSASGSELSYELDSEVAAEIYGYFHSQSVYPTTGWVYPWGSIENVSRYHSALFTLCIYHLIAVFWGAHRIGATQLCEHNACLLIEPSNLNSKIAQLSGLDANEVSLITEALTYGHKTNSPDPALQPLIPVSQTQIAVPGTVILTNAWPRNQMSLHIRLDPDDFHKRSHVFELQMTSRLVDGSATKPFRLVTDIKLAKEQIDLVLIDDANKTILLAELRWVLTPGSIKEIHNKQKAVLEKTTQAQRKLTACEKKLAEVLKRLSCTGDGWRIHAIVAVEGFAGLPSDRPKSIPIVPSSVLAAATHGFDDLNRLHAFFCSPLWLPRRDADFTGRPTYHSVLGHTFRTDPVLAADGLYLGGSFDRYMREANDMTLDDLQAVPW